MSGTEENVVLISGGRMFGRPDEKLRKKGTPEQIAADERRVALETAYVFNVLDALHATRTITKVVHGKAKGADTVADGWARARGIEVEGVEADWRPGGRFDKGAGFRRNWRMAREFNVRRCVAFPGGKGTGHQVETCRACHIPTWEVPAPIDPSSIPTFRFRLKPIAG